MKKLLILTTFPIHEKKLQLENCKSQYHIFTYFLNKYIKNFDIILQYVPIMGNSSRIKNLYKNFNCKKADHCIVIDNRGLLRRPLSFYNELRKQINGCISTISASCSIKGNEDILFYMIPSGKRKRQGRRFIGWACDNELIKPSHKKDKINILIDHPYYGRQDSRMIEIDQTLNISKQVYDFAKNKSNIIVKRFCKGGIEILNEDNYNKMDKYVQNEGLNYHDACKIYSETDIFFVTHAECMGLVVLECAMGGALIVSPIDFIKKELLRYINHVKINNKFNMNEIVSKIDHNKSRKLVERFNWINVCKVIEDSFLNFEEYKKKDLWFLRSLKI